MALAELLQTALTSPGRTDSDMQLRPAAQLAVVPGLVRESMQTVDAKLSLVTSRLGCSSLTSVSTSGRIKQLVPVQRSL